MIILSVLALFLLNYEIINGEELQASSASTNIVCRLFPETFKEKCDEYFKKIKETESFIIKANVIVERENKIDVKSVQCDLCKKILNDVVNSIKGKIETEIRNALSNICNNFPPFTKGACHDFVNRFTNDIVNEIMKNLNPDEICKNIHLCSSFLNQMSNDAKSIQCDICKDIINAILSSIKEKTEPEIRRALNNICNSLPPLAQGICHDIVNRFADDIINGIMKNLSPDEICRKINLCISQLNDISNANSMRRNLRDREYCNLCKDMIFSMEDNFNMSINASVIQSHFLTICDILNIPYKDQCINFLKGTGLQVIRDILSNRDPKQICQSLQLCAYNNRMKDFLKILKLLFNLSKISSKRISNSCETCLERISFLEEVTNHSKSLEDVWYSFTEICEVFKLPSKIICLSEIYSSSYTKLFELILAKGNPKIICRWLQFCSTKDDKVNQKINYSEEKQDNFYLNSFTNMAMDNIDFIH